MYNLMFGIKERPSRIFLDKKSKKYYVLHKGQRKLVNIPKGYNLKKAQEYIIDQLYGRVSKSKKPIKDKYFSFEKPKPVRPIYSDYKKQRIELEKSQDSGDKKRLDYYREKIKNGIALTEEEKQDYEIVKKKIEKEQEKIDIIKKNKLLVENKLNKEEQKELKELIDIEEKSRKELKELIDIEEKSRKELKPSKFKDLKKKLFGPKKANAPPSSPREEKEKEIKEKEIKEKEIKEKEIKEKEIKEKEESDDEEEEDKSLNPIKEPEIFNAMDYLPVATGYQLSSGIPPPNEFKKSDEKYPNEIKYRRLKQLREDRSYDFFRLVKNNFDLDKSDLPQFYAWNGVLNSNKIIVNILYKTIQWLEEQDTETLQNIFNGLYNITNSMDKEQIIKQVLKYLDPIQYITLVSFKKIPSFGRFDNPEQLGKGNKEMKENTNTKLPALYDDEIVDFFKDNNNFGGVISSDEVHKLPKHIPMGFIMNLDPRNKEGSHWVACYMSGDSIEYFDPFGENPSDDFLIRMHKFINDMQLPTLQKLKINKIKQQHGNSFRCGYHCIRFLDDRFNDIPWVLSTRFQKPNEILDNSKNGEKKIKEEFKYI